ncbi:hypothetical protein [Mangrovicoccus sp. HB161399]|uniref:hypothetical protein n=1 Tax=Mangrovicoccus sp. HB161399 TaxID=2720392 RepID=UPI0015528C27|nr:hypothetical protein [Mangrovicoccus sp. HB161399]
MKTLASLAALLAASPALAHTGDALHMNPHGGGLAAVALALAAGGAALLRRR